MAENRNAFVKTKVLHHDMFRKLVEGDEDYQKRDSKYWESGFFRHDACLLSSAKVSFGSPLL